jgi:hypothetical protein
VTTDFVLCLAFRKRNSWAIRPSPIQQELGKAFLFCNYREWVKIHN